jgi:hypothetical protein
MKRIIAALSALVLVSVGAGVSIAGASGGPEIDFSGATVTMAKTTFNSISCSGTETYGGVEHAETYETLTGTWRGTSTDSLPGDTPYSLTGSFDVNNLVWTINERSTSPPSNPYTGVLTGTAALTNNEGVTIEGPITLITQGNPNSTDSGATVEARGWVVGSIYKGTVQAPGRYLLNVAFKIGSGYSASGLWGNAAFGFHAFSAYDNGVVC